MIGVALHLTLAVIFDFTENARSYMCEKCVWFSLVVVVVEPQLQVSIDVHRWKFLMPQIVLTSLSPHNFNNVFKLIKSAPELYEPCDHTQVGIQVKSSCGEVKAIRNA